MIGSENQRLGLLIICSTFSLLPIILSTLAFFGPNSPLASGLSQITIAPSTKLQPPSLAAATTTPDGPTLRCGIFGENKSSRPSSKLH
jgi:hypothetical protein